MASGSWDKTVRIWDVNTGDPLQTLTGHTGRVYSVSFSPDGQTLASGSWDGTVRIWDVNTGRQLRTLTGHMQPVNSVSFSSDGQKIATGSDDETVRLWDANTGDPLRTLTGHTFLVNSVSFSPDGQKIATGNGDGWVRIWDVNTGAPLQTVRERTAYVNSVSFSPDGQTLASGSGDSTVRLWNVNTGARLQTLTGHTDSVSSVSFSPDGQTLASGSVDNTVRIWDVNTGAPLQTLTGHTGWVSSVSFSPDGQTLASGSWDGTVRIWDANTGAPLQTFTGHTDLWSLAFLLVLMVRRWQVGVGTGQCVFGMRTRVLLFRPSRGIRPVVFSVSFSPDGQTLATGSWNGTVLLWDLMPASTPQLPEDVNSDGVVNIQDLVAVAAALGAAGDTPADVNGDGVVNIQDLVAVAAAFGTTAAAPELWHLDPKIAPTRDQVERWLRQARQLNLSDPDFQRGILRLEQLLAALTPKETALLPNYPNPFNPETWIPYQLAEPAEVSISIYAADGTLIRTLMLGHQPIGIYESRSRAAYWDGRNAVGEPVASGVYFYTLTAGDFTATRKMLIMK